jgi:drug/metabolite transporter (DMT)-like permease
VAFSASAAVSGGSARNYGVLCAVLGAFGFSFKSVLIRSAYRYGVDAATLLCLRMGYSLPLLLLMALALEHVPPTALSRRDWFELSVLGLFGYYLSSYLDFMGLRYITAALERVVLFIYPTLVVLLSALFLGVPLTRKIVLVLLVSYAGVLLSVVGNLRSGLHATAVGVALVLGSALSFAIYLLRSGQTVQRLGSTIVTIYATGIACIACVLQFVCLRPLSALRLPWQVHALGAALALFSTVLPIWLVTEAIRRLGASTAAMIATLGPVLTILLANLFLHEPLNLLQFAGAALVILSVMYLTDRKRALAPS